MKFSVKNLGPIKEGTIAFDKPLTVLVGPNSSGKSYVAYLLYGVLRQEIIYLKSSFKTKRFIMEKLEEYEDDKYRFKLSDMKGLINSVIKSTIERTVDRAIPTYFSSKLVQPELNLEIGAKQFDDFLRRIKKQLTNYKYQHIAELNVDDDYIYKGKAGWCNTTKGEKKSFYGAINEFLNKVVNRLRVKDIYMPARLQSDIKFFPTERLALGMISNDEVERKSKKLDKISQLLLEDDIDEFDIASYIKKERNEESKYPLAISDYMYYINDLLDISKQTSKFEYFADEIELMLTKGTIGVSEYGGITYTPEDSEKTLDIHLTSSLIKSLSGLILYFRHQAKEGDTLIIDEPEVNLHPNNQRIVARVLAKAVNLGFRLVISTHSDYLLRELNNLILLDSIYKDEESKKEILAEYTQKGYDETTKLSKEDVGVYYFFNNTIEELTVNQYGFEVESIDKEVYELNDATDDFYTKLRELEV